MLLLDLPHFHWDFREAEFYRRRNFPVKFLQNECSKYPCYVFQSPLSKAFNTKKYIEAEIDISKLAPGASPVIHKEELVTSTSEFIENIRRKAEKHVNIRAEEGHVLILRTAGFREYFEGNYQLLQYERVRLALRKKTRMMLELTQIRKDYRAATKFPPLYMQINP